MMPVWFEGCNTRFGPPEGMSDEECMTVDAMTYIHINNDGSNQVFVITAWKPSKEDLDALNAGRPIFLQIYRVMPPAVSIYTLDENNQPN